jgi:hypothetical protein
MLNIEWSAMPQRSARLRFGLFTFVAPLLALLAAGGASAQQAFTGGGAISVSSSQTTAGSSTLSVSGATGSAIATVQVTINGVTTNGNTGYSMGVADFVLTSPTGAQLVLLGATGDTSDNGGLSGVTINVVDTGSAAPNGTPWSSSGGTVKPSSYWNDNGFSPPFGTSIDWPQADGSATLNGRFGGAAPDGTWTLSIQNFEATTPVSIASWSLTLTYAAVTPTTTVISSNSNPALASGSVTLTATVTSTGGTPTGTVNFTSDGTTISGCGAEALSGGVTHCTTSFASQGLDSIVASYTPAGSFGTSSGSMNELVEVNPTHSSNQWCNNNSFTIPSDATPSVYPSIIKVSGYPAGTTISNLTIELEGATGPNGVYGQHLLVAPDGTHNLDFLDHAWALQAPASPINATLFDTAGQTPNSSQAPSTGNYEAYDNDQNLTDTFPSSLAPNVDSSVPQVPGTINDAAPRGGSSALDFETAFNGAVVNGDWALYTYTDETETLNSGYCITFDINTGVTTTTTVASSKNPQTTGQSVTLTATVTSGGSPVTSGTVTFLDSGVAPAGTVSGNNVVTLNGSGQATFTTGSLTEGDHAITADYSGTVNDNPSVGAIVQRIDDATSVTASSATSAQYCNTGAVSSASGQSGAFTPNPSNIFVTNLPGTIGTVSLTLDNFSTANDQIYEIESLVAGPSSALDFFSNTGASNTVLSLGNYSFLDSAGSHVPQSAFGPGSYLPTSYNNVNDTADSFFASTSGFYTLPGSFNYSAPRGSSTFASTFASKNPNGTWSLYFDQLEKGSAVGAANGWCLNFTENTVTVDATLSNGTFVQGEQGAQINVNASNSGTGPTGDPTGNYPFTVTDALNSAFTYSSFTGTGWSCSAAGQTVTCKNDSPIAQSSSYPTLTLNVNVSPTASGTITDSISFSGAGATPGTATDSITVEPAPALSVFKSHVGTFTQGQIGEWQIAVSNTAAPGSATTGTINVSDTLPTGYTLSSYSSTASDWTCGSSANVVTCSSTSAIGSGTSSVITLMVNIPAGSPASVTNTALAWGGGDLTHTSLGTAASGTDANVPVVQVPASVIIDSGNNQSATVGTAFAAPLTVTVEDANSVAISGYNVTFTANPGSSGQSGTFSNSTGTIQVGTNGSGVASAGTFKAGSKTGAYTVNATAGTASATFNLTNTPAAPANITITSGNGQSTLVRAGFTNPLAVTVTDSFGNAVPNATVTFAAPMGSTASITFSNASTTISQTTNSLGQASSGSITANAFAGSYNVQASVNSVMVNFNLTNTPLTPGVSLTASSDLIDEGNPVTFTATVTGNGSIVPTGTVTFTSGLTVFGTSPLNGSGVATLIVPRIPIGDHGIAATYNGDGTYAAATSRVFDIRVDGLLTPTLMVVPSTTSAPKNTPVIVTATVSGSGPQPTGEVYFYDSLTPNDTITVVLNGAGTAMYTPVTEIEGTHSITVIYSGDNNYKTLTSSPITVTITPPVKLTPTLMVVPSTTSAPKNTPVSVTATVSGTGPQPTGEVYFYDSLTPNDIISVYLNGAGVAIDTGIVTEIEGTHTITVVYSGDVNYQPQISSPITVTITPPSP